MALREMDGGGRLREVLSVPHLDDFERTWFAISTADRAAIEAEINARLAPMLDSYYHYARRQGPVNRQFRVPLLDGEQAGSDLVRDELNRFGNEIVQRRLQYPPTSEQDEARGSQGPH